MIKRKAKRGKKEVQDDSMISDSEFDYKSLGKKLSSYKSNFDMLLQQVEGLREENSQLVDLLDRVKEPKEPNMVEKLLSVISQIVNNSSNELIDSLKDAIQPYESNLQLNEQNDTLSTASRANFENSGQKRNYTKLVNKLMDIVNQPTNPNNTQNSQSNYKKAYTRTSDLDDNRKTLDPNSSHPSSIRSVKRTNGVIPQLNVECLYEEDLSDSFVLSPQSNASFFSHDSIFNVEMDAGIQGKIALGLNSKGSRGSGI